MQYFLKVYYSNSLVYKIYDLKDYNKYLNYIYVPVGFPKNAIQQGRHLNQHNNKKKINDLRGRAVVIIFKSGQHVDLSKFQNNPCKKKTIVIHLNFF